jgi:hypothetical protein
MIPALLVLALAVERAVRRRSATAWLVVPLLLPILIMSMGRVGNLLTAYARFLIPGLPLVFILIAEFLLSSRGRPGGSLSALLLACVALANARHLVLTREWAHRVPFHRIAAAARSISSEAAYVLVGPPVHQLGFKLSGVPLQRELIDAVRGLSGSPGAELVVIDMVGFSEGLERTDVGTIRVARYTGQAREVAETIAASLLARLPAIPDRRVQVAAAEQLVPVLQWLGHEMAAREAERIASQPLPERYLW